MRCNAITKAGQPCKALAAKGQDKCLFHSGCDVVNRGGQKPLTIERMIRILEIQCRKCLHIKDVGEQQARETRAILNQILILRGYAGVDKASADTGLVEGRVAKWKKSQT